MASAAGDSYCASEAGYEISDREELALSDLLEPSRNTEGCTSPTSGTYQLNSVTGSEMHFFSLNLLFLLPWDKPPLECRLFQK